MSFSKDRSLYKDVQDALDRALASTRGIKLTFSSGGSAVQFRHRIYSLRKLDRHESRAIYKPGDDDYDRSPYDRLTIQIEGTNIFIRTDSPPLIEEL